jgi:hypothetical protein
MLDKVFMTYRKAVRSTAVQDANVLKHRTGRSKLRTPRFEGLLHLDHREELL